jgi:biopolymer transport protein ExbB
MTSGWLDNVWLLAQAGGSAAGTSGGGGGGAGGAGGTTIADLFRQSADLFTLVLLLGSIVVGTVIVRCFIEVRRARITPDDSEAQIRRMLTDANLAGLETYLQRDSSFYSHVLRAALAVPVGAQGAYDRAAIRNAAELAASEQCARWFRKIEPLNVIGNLGPLVGLAGTVYGMVLAFVRLSNAGGQANPGMLSGDIGKALFHTLLGLVVAIPALLVFGLYRAQIDKVCTRAMAISAELVEQLCVLREAGGSGGGASIDASRASAQAAPPGQAGAFNGAFAGAARETR